MNANELATVLGMEVRPFKNADGTLDASKVAIRARDAMRFTLFAAVSGVTPFAIETGLRYVWGFYDFNALANVSVEIPALPTPTESPALVAYKAKLAAMEEGEEEGEEEEDEDEEEEDEDEEEDEE